jgi:hypothetical protein
MNIKRTRSVLFLAVAAAAGLLAGGLPPSASAALLAPDDPALAGLRYRTMRALAHYLDETAQGMLEGASDDVLFATPSEARFMSSIRSFARSGSEFRTMMDGYQVTPFEVQLRLADLTNDAHLLNDRIRAARALQGTYDEWDAVIEVLERMELHMAGDEVKVPAAYVVPGLAGPKLAEFRQLAAELEISATRAYERGKQGVGDYPARGRQFLGELHYFATLSRDLHAQADAPDVSPKHIGGIVDLLLAEARQADRRMRDAKVFPQVWDDSGRTITILQRMASLVRS